MFVALAVALTLLSINTVLLYLSLKKDSSRFSPLAQNFRNTQADLERSIRAEFAQSRAEVATAARDGRQELLNSFSALSGDVSFRINEFRTEITSALGSLGGRLESRMGEAINTQATQLEANSANVSNAVSNSGRAVSSSLEQLRSAISQQLAGIQGDTSEKLELIRNTTEMKLSGATSVLASSMESLSSKMSDSSEKLRLTVETKLASIENNNNVKLEQMRATVDEKLHATLEQRLGESFRLVSQRLEEVHQGLGEMRNLASGVGDLKKTLMNIRARGNWGEVQLGALLEQMLAPGQYAANVAPDPDSSERVEYAIKLPGRDGSRETVWLPIDSKFPHQDYERLIEAAERGDKPSVEHFGAALEESICAEARKIRDKYIRPPHTLDFALLFLPTEGLFAEVLRRPGMYDRALSQRVVIAGPTTLAALLSSLQMGFRTLAVEKRSGEVWKILGGVKSEFNKFGDALKAVEKKLNEASNKLGDVHTRSRVITRRLRDVQEEPAANGETPLQLDSIAVTDEASGETVDFSRLNTDQT
jgi:DNA recombination protein RmuC